MLGWPLWILYVVVFALTVVVGGRLVVAAVEVAIATRRRRAHHRMVVDLVGISPDSAPEVCTRASGLRILDVPQPLAYCLPGVRSRVVVSEGTLTTLSNSEISAILSHERAHLRARHDLVLEMFTAVHAAFPRFVRSGNALDAVRLLIEMLADDAAVRAAGPHSPGARAGRVCLRPHAVGRPGGRWAHHRVAGAAPGRAAQQPACWRRRRIWRRRQSLIMPTVALAVPWLTELQRLFVR